MYSVIPKPANVQRFLPNFFHGVFGRARCYLDCLCCVVLCCVLMFASYCVVLCCDVVICLLLVTLLTLVCWPKLSQFSCSSLYDSTQQLDGHTMVLRARPTRRLNKQNFHCVFSTGKHCFLHGGFVITTTFYVPSVVLVKLAKISSLSLTSAFW